MKQFKVLFSTGTLLNRLLRKYAFILVSFITIAIIGISVNTYFQNYNLANAVVKDALQNTMRMPSDRTTVNRLIKDQLVGSPEKIQNVTSYLTLSIPDYFNFVYDNQDKSPDYVSFTDQIQGIYAEYSEVTSIYIILKNTPDYFQSTTEDKGGRIYKGTPKLDNGFYIKSPILLNSDEKGSIFIGFEKEGLENSLSTLSSFEGLSVYMVSSTNNRLYTYHDAGMPKSHVEWQEKTLTHSLEVNSRVPVSEFYDDYLVEYQQLNGEYRILATLDKQMILRKTAKDIFFLIIGGILLDGILIYSLSRTFTKYSTQLTMVMNTMEKASEGNLDVRIDTEKTEYELKELSDGINHMLKSINQYVEDIYKLEIKQQDAHMRALQSQINPHFLYNTLEYIRMYAISEGSEELAEVVYAFSALLRNNTNQEKTTQLKAELDFCEKYVYLYQMRYPKRIAYHFTVAPELENLQVPKFIIQPLVENYFVHGIDFTRTDNAISIKAETVGNLVQILIRDNGRGIPTEKLAEIEKRLNYPKIQLYHSIGLQNVNERLRAYFGASYKMVLSNNVDGGLVIQISFEKGVGKDV
ncbi:ATP-binding protein [Enterococcus sp. JM4C]|uniref:sensor histidine kinase n=1 Tax=Candidatus Enterococcus huntleyi TaxID=1857217 RepID=UPI00137B1624|nr:sensor histidine kinase [Enterococcus sp. JM4C]KAF1296699.1 ATP-binding protein [Enterococcus sp. JM4C]